MPNPREEVGLARAVKAMLDAWSEETVDPSDTVLAGRFDLHFGLRAALLAFLDMSESEVRELSIEAWPSLHTDEDRQDRANDMANVLETLRHRISRAGDGEKQ